MSPRRQVFEKPVERILSLVAFPIENVQPFFVGDGRKPCIGEISIHHVAFPVFRRDGFIRAKNASDVSRHVIYQFRIDFFDLRYTRDMLCQKNFVNLVGKRNFVRGCTDSCTVNVYARFELRQRVLEAVIDLVRAFAFHGVSQVLFNFGLKNPHLGAKFADKSLLIEYDFPLHKTTSSH